jgi:transcriptional antiterminator
MSTLPLDSRQAGIARLLLDGVGVASVEQVATELQLTHRIVRYNLPWVEAYLAEHGLRLEKRRGVGVWIDGDETARATVRAGLDSAPGPAVLDAADRQSRVLLALLESAPDALRSETLEARLGVSRPTVRRDVRVAEAWLEQHRLHLRRLPGVGLAVRGSEVDVRSALLGLVLERVPANVLAAYAAGPGATGPAWTGDGGPAGLAAYVTDLDLPTFRAILEAELRDFDDRDPTLLTATVSLAILARRVRADHPARLVRGRLRSLMDHPVSDAALRIAAAIDDRIGVRLGSPETASITESLLGFVELSDSRAVPEARLVALIDRLVAAAAVKIHPSLGDDALLRANLTEHVRRLHVRLRYGLPISNPLQREVQKRYPDVYAIAGEILAEVGPLDGSDIPLEEVGFLTMYLAGSLERQRLRPKIQVTVVCPAGMATAWILVSRLLAEFPQLEVVQVVSKPAFEHEAEGVSTDLVISTVPLEGMSGRVPWLVVSPLLQERDVRRLARLVGPAA